MTDRIPLDHLTSDQYDQLCDQLDALQLRAARMEHATRQAAELAVRLEDAENLAEQHARNTETVARERESYRKAWKEAQRMRAKAEHRVRELEPQADPELQQRLEAAIAALGKSETELAALRKVARVRPGLVEDGNSVTDVDPAWTPPPPGDKREQLPDALLALIDVPPYTSTACEAAILLARQMPEHTHRRIELGEHSDRLHDRCRRNNKFTGALCGCHCHA